MCISRFGLINREGHLPGLCHYAVKSFTNYFGKILPVIDHLSTYPWLTFAKEFIYFINIIITGNVCKKRKKFNIRPVLSLPDSSGICPEVPQGPEGQSRPDLSPTFRFFRISRVFPRPETSNEQRSKLHLQLR